MDTLRGRLISKLDDILAQLATQDTPSNSQLHIEANLVLPNDSTVQNRRVVLDSIDIDEVKHHVASNSGSSGTNTPRPYSASNGYRSSSSSLPIANSVNSVSPEHPMNDVSGPVTVIDPLQTHASNVDIDRPSTGSVLPGIQAATDPTPPTTPPIYSTGLRVPLEHPFSAQQTQQDNHAQSTQPSPLDKLIEGIWEQIHHPKSLVLGDDLKETMQKVFDAREFSASSSQPSITNLEFSSVTRYCRQITTGSRTARAFEVLIQAHWVDCFDARLAALQADRQDLKPQVHKKAVLLEARNAFDWSEKELRNRMGIWKGYRDIKDAAGWVALVFAGPGIYRFCKYRQAFNEEAMGTLRAIRVRAEVAADTLQPQWRQLLSLVGEPTDVHWHGHPHDWTVSLKEGQNALPLAITYKQWDPDFSFEHLDESIIDTQTWGTQDPRRFEPGPDFFCKSCSQRQSAIPEDNACECYPELYSPKPRNPAPVQIFRTDNGKNNGLIACCAYNAGQAIGEFIGLITKGLADVDVMQSQAGDNEPYQIWQGRCGNFTRFINHSCAPNCQFQTFSWLGVQRIVVVSGRDVAAGEELTVDYSDRYWNNLDKICLCGAPECRYKDRRK